MHNIEHYNYPVDANKANIEKELNEYVSVETRFEGGSGLPSKIRWLNHTCESCDEALEYIESNDRKWYDQLAVMYKEYPAVVKTTKRMTDLKNQIAKVRGEISAYEIEHSVRNFKAEYVGCPHCGSKIKRELLKRDWCPVCGEDMRSKTTLDTLKRMGVKLRTYERKLDEEAEKEARKNKPEIRWLVKIEYHT